MKAGSKIFFAIIFALFFNCKVLVSQGPSITSISPTVGPVSPGGGSVTITGSGFGATQANSSVTFDSTHSIPSSWGDNTIIVPVPGTLVSGFVNIVVTVGGLASNAQSFLVIPVIVQDSPTDGSVGTSVDILGTSFGDQQGNSTITFGGVATTPIFWSNTSITATVPNTFGAAPIVVTVNGFGTNGATFHVLPNIATVGSGVGSIGSSVTITGTGFGTNQGFGGVTFNGTPALVQNWSNTAVTVTVPNGATSGNVVLQTALLLSSNALSFTVGAPPGVISTLTPASGVAGSQVTVAGSNFGSTQGSGSVTFNGISALIGSWTDSTITAFVPAGASTGGVVVVASGAPPSNSLGFVVAPNLVSLYPSSGGVGAAVTIGGSGFGVSQGSGAVIFNGTAIAVTSWSNSRVTFFVPGGSTIGNATVSLVTTNGSTANILPFAVIPAITALSPNSGTAGTVVTIRGSNFGNIQGTSTASLNGLNAQISAWSDTQITATVPTGALTGFVRATVAGFNSNPVSFSVACVSASGAITITPSNFALFPGGSVPITAVNDCGQPVTGVTWASADPTIAAVTSDDPPRILGEDAGSTTITATSSGLSAQANVNVIAVQGFADGTPVYSIATASDAAFSLVIPATRTADHDTALFFVDARTSALSIRATSLSGTQLWSTSAPRVGNFDLVPDNSGGLVGSFVVAAGQAVIENIDANGNPLWTYSVPTNPSGSFGPRLSIASDGTIYFVDDGGNIVALDGNSGTPKFAVPAAQFTDFQSGHGGFDVFIMSDGSACTALVQSPLGNASFANFPNQPVLIGLTCVKPNGNYTTSIVASATSTLTTNPDGTTSGDIFSLIPLKTIPGENGNVLVLWQKTQQHILPNQPTTVTRHVYLSVGNSGARLQLPAACDNIDFFGFNTFNMVLGDAGNALITCGNPSVQSSLVSLNISAGSPNWVWSVPSNHDIALNSAAPGGGASVVDITFRPNALGTAQQWNVVDLDGIGTATYEPWSVTANDGNENLFYIHDGLYIFNTPASNALIMATANDTDSAWPNDFEQQEQKRAKSVEFQQDQECSGFDETLEPHILALPANPSSASPLIAKTVIAKLHGKIQTDVIFESNNPSVTISPTSATGSSTTLTITATSALDPMQTNPVIIKAISSADSHLYGTLMLVVKPKLMSQNFHMYSITESVKHLTPQTVPTASSLQNYLNNVTWGLQANVFFNVPATDPISLSTNYDLLPINADGTHGDGTLNDFRLDFFTVETKAILDKIHSVNGNADATFDHTMAIYINKIGPPPGSATANCTTFDGQPCEIEGETFTGEHISYMQDVDPKQSRSNSRENVTAHEIGHGMGAGHRDTLFPKKENMSLMWPGLGLKDPLNPCRIRDKEWRIANPTPGDGMPPK